MFSLRNKKNNFSYALLSGGLNSYTTGTNLTKLHRNVHLYVGDSLQKRLKEFDLSRNMAARGHGLSLYITKILTLFSSETGGQNSK